MNIIQWSCNISITFDESSVVSSESQERTYLFNSLGYWPSSNRFSLFADLFVSPGLKLYAQGV